MFFINFVSYIKFESIDSGSIGRGETTSTTSKQTNKPRPRPNWRQTALGTVKP